MKTSCAQTQQMNKRNWKRQTWGQENFPLPDLNGASISKLIFDEASISKDPTVSVVVPDLISALSLMSTTSVLISFKYDSQLFTFLVPLTYKSTQLMCLKLACFSVLFCVNFALHIG